MWMKVDDRLHAHRKTRTVLRSSPNKTRDSAPMGLWVLAGSWSAQNNTNGWVPTSELERFDDDWPSLVKRLVAADYWWPETRDGEEGFGFVDWSEWNTSKERQSADGKFGNHERWHVRRKRVKPGCEFCPVDPESDPESEGESGGESLPDIGGRSITDRGGESEIIALPDPTRTRPDPKTPCAPADADCATDDAQCADDAQASDAQPVDAQTNRFEEFWTIYDKKKDRKRAEQKYRLALKKPGVDHASLIDAASRYVTHQKAIGKHPEFTKNADTWLNGECWNDDLEDVTARRESESLVDVRDLAKPPPGLSTAEYVEWAHEQKRLKEANR